MITELYTHLVAQLKSSKGQTLVEYGLILALVSVVVIAVLGLMSDALFNVFSNVTDELEGAAEIQQKQ